MGKQMKDKKYTFTWDYIGDLEAGRPNLGPMVRVEMYRLMQFALRDILESSIGTEDTEDIFREAGRLAGLAFHNQFFSDVTDFNEYIRVLQKRLRTMGIGILRVEEVDVENNSFIFTVSEDLECSGLSETDYEVCMYDEGFISGLMEGYTGEPYKTKELDCWCTGDRTCRFAVEISQ
jgi:predicted hydrocarbon binding protein